jgi:hypothetical protein
VGHVTGWYQWRDPARLTAARRAELARHDATHGTGTAIDACAGTGQDRMAAAAEALSAAARDRRARFAALRDDGVSVCDAAVQVGVCIRTGRKYELARRRALTPAGSQ